MSSEEMRTKSARDIRILSQERVFQGYFHVDKYHAQYRLFDGGWSEIISREIFVRGHSVAVLLYDPLRDKVVLIEQCRLAALQDPNSPWLIEIVAGILEENENPQEIARKETSEEAGLSILELIPICGYWVSPGGSSEYTHLFCGKVDSTRAEGLHGLSAEDEDIRVHVVTTKEALNMIQFGWINSAAAIIALQWLVLNKDTIFI